MFVHLIIGKEGPYRKNSTDDVRYLAIAFIANYIVCDVTQERGKVRRLEKLIGCDELKSSHAPCP